MRNIENISHYGDILAIPFFALLSIYFYTISDNDGLTNSSYFTYYISMDGIKGQDHRREFHSPPKK
jgi:hypothetical protein